MVRRLMLLISVVVTLCGFVSVSDQMQEQLKTLPQHYSNFDVKMAWNVKTIGGNTIIEGIIQNVRYAIMDDIKIKIALVDANGKMIRQATDFIIPRQLALNDTSPFSVKLPAVAPRGAKLVFTYRYMGFDGGGGRDGGPGGLDWMQSFESKPF